MKLPLKPSTLSGIFDYDFGGLPDNEKPMSFTLDKLGKLHSRYRKDRMVCDEKTKPLVIPTDLAVAFDLLRDPDQVHYFHSISIEKTEKGWRVCGEWMCDYTGFTSENMLTAIQGWMFGQLTCWFEMPLLDRHT